MQLIGPENGADAVTWLKARNPDLQVIFVTGTQDAELLHRIDAVNPQEVFSKPVDPACLVEALGGMAG
jgi:DNA-binding NarL/FixJ family response regulator